MEGTQSTPLLTYSKMNNPNVEASRVIKRSPRLVTMQELSPDGSGNSKSNLNFTINVNQGSRIARRVMMRMKNLRVSFRVNQDVGNDVNLRVIAMGERDGLQSFPLNRMYSTTVVRPNNTSLSFQSNQCIPVYSSFVDDFHLRERVNSSSPCKVDTTLVNYLEGHATYLNPLSSGSSFSTGRGTLNYVIEQNDQLSNIADAEAVILFPELTEPLIHPVLNVGEYDDGTFSNVQQLTITINYHNSIESQIWSHLSNAGIAGDFEITDISWESVTALVTYVDPSEDVDQRPPVCRLAAWNVVPYTSGRRTLAPGGVGGVFLSNNISLSGVPHKIISMVKPTDSFRSAAWNWDQSLPIENLRVTFANQTLASTFTPVQNYEVCVRNGLDRTFNEWLGAIVSQDQLPFNDVGKTQLAQGAGAVMAFSWEDIGGVSMSMAPGTAGRFDMQIQLTCGNVPGPQFWPPGTAGVEYEMYTFIIYDGMMEIFNNYTTTYYSPIFSPLESSVLREQTRVIDVDDYEHLIGGKFSLSGLFKGARSILQKAPHFIGKALPIARVLADTASAVGVPGAGLISTGLDVADKLHDVYHKTHGGASLGGRRRGLSSLKKRI